jgi:hypothetical protein
MRPEEIGDLLGTDPESVIVAREAALEQLASELGYYDSPDLDDLRTRLTTLPNEAWTPPQPVEDERPALTVVPDESEAAPEREKPERERPPRADPPRKSRLPMLLTLLAVAGVVLVIVLASGGDDATTATSTPAPSPQPAKPKASSKPSKPAKKPSKKPAKPAAPKPAPAAAGVKLAPVAAAAGATGSASLVDGGKRLHLTVSGLPAGAYEVWLYDSVIDARSIGKATGSKIALDVALRPNASSFRYVDVSREPADGNPNHSGQSVMRVALAKLSR